MAYKKFTLNIPARVLTYVKAEESRKGVTTAEIIRGMLNEMVDIREAKEEARERRRRPAPRTEESQMTLDCSSS